MRAFAPFFIVFAILWVVQLYATAKQGQHFMREVGRLRQHGETAIGASSNNRFRRRSYVAVASDETDLVTAAIELAGLTVFARATPVPELVGIPLEQLAEAPDGDRRSNAARMAARSLLGMELEPSADAPASSDQETSTVSSRPSSHLPSSAPREVREPRERGA